MEHVLDDQLGEVRIFHGVGRSDHLAAVVSLTTYLAANQETPMHTSQLEHAMDLPAPTMVSIVQEEYGAAPEQVLRLKQIAKPAIGDEEILVRVRAASVDR